MPKRIVIIGGGPAGYVGAIRAAQLGAEVVLVEQGTLGGTCLNVGCIPTKALLASADLYNRMKSAAQFGLRAENLGFDWPAIQKRKERVVRKAVAGVASLMKARKVEVINGQGKVAGPNQVVVTSAQGPVQTLSGDGILVATGSAPIKLNITGIDLPGITDSTGALALAQVPARLVILGGGVIGCEMADIYASFGSQVTIVEMMPQLIPGEDPDAVQVLHRALRKKGVEIRLESKVVEFQKTPSGISCTVEDKAGQKSQVEAETVLISVGRRASIQGLGLEDHGVAVERGFVKVDPAMATSQPGIYAAGDCTGGWLLAHVASREAETAVENMLGHTKPMDYRAVPRCVYTHPEIASGGVLDRPENREEVLVGVFPFSANGKASCLGELEGFVKVVADRASREVIGGVIVGPAATELIAELTLAVTTKTKVEELVEAIHAHPTLHEATAEAALGCLGRAIHLP